MKKFTSSAVVSALVTLFITATANPAAACSLDGKEGFLPENNRYIPVRQEVLDSKGNPLGGGITHAEFDGVIDSVLKVYSPIVKAMGGNLIVKRNWNDGTVNAFADRNDGNWNLNMFGGLARSKETTIDAFLVVMCHELGHQIGGAPKFSDPNSGWAGVEGQADYWSTAKCTRRILQNQPNLRALAALGAPDSVRIACQKSFANNNDAALCIRTSMAGNALADLLANLGSENVPDFATPDRSIVKTTFEPHPAAQCRLDTYFAGSLCPVAFSADVSQTDPLVNTCAQETGATVGYRSRCWYAPTQKNNSPSINPRASFRGRAL
jgi:hypothetical protein